uniref:Uncharacterized protein LOC116304487 n=1 Tax=Actinia tenebrosa TaxID=6105 RepID=A0A6P8IT39_ACTTE
MEQKALLSQQENQQEEMQGLPNQQQETVAFQGPQQQNQEGQLLRQEEDEQQSAPQDGIEQYQQGVGRQTTEQQQINVQEQGGQEGNNQEMNLQEGGEQGNVMQQGANQEAAFQQGNEQVNGEQQDEQMESSFHQENGPEVVPQQGNEQENFLQQGNEQEQNPQHGEMQEATAAYQQQDNEQQTGPELQGDSSEQRGTDVGSIANLFSDSNDQGTGQDQETQSFINEGQSITKNDASQLAAAIANANKGLNTGEEQNSLANLASNSAGSLSFTGGEQAPSSEGVGNLGSSVNRFTPDAYQETNSFSLVDHPEENTQKIDTFSQQYEQSGPSSSPNLEQEFMKIDGSPEHPQHVNTGIGNILSQESVKIVNLDHAVANKAAKYCTGCPRNARCIDKVCILNDDQPLAKILGALSGPENETDDCRGCHHNAKCIKKECICKPGFTGDGVECRADSCLPGCSKHGKCIRGFCVCGHHHYFNGVECSPFKIRHRECPDRCAVSCLPECPNICCKSHMATPKPAETTITTAATAAPTAPTKKPTIKPITKTSNKKVGPDAAADFYLKPTLHSNADVFNKHPHQEKHLQSSNQVLSSKLSTPHKNITSSEIKYNTTKILKPQSEEKNGDERAKTRENCHPECSGEKCGPSCPDHCCQLSKPNLQIDFLKAFAEKFCPSACQNKCQNTCPPICCEKRSFASILKSSPGASNVDVNKAEDIFRNAMGWFGMMNFLHMMYNMYGNMYMPPNMMMTMKNPQKFFANAFRKMQVDQNGKIKAEVPASPYTSIPCEPACAKSCISSCPERCCLKRSFSAEAESDSGYHKYGPKVTQQLSKIGQALYTSCPSDCATFCSPKCPPSCCVHPQVPKKLSPSTSKDTAPSCKTGCSPRCYPLCMESCCKAIQRTVQVRPTTRSFILTTTPTKAAYGCPLQCPRSCFPSCTRDCCSASEQYKPGLLNGHGQYMVSIPCPMECRPYNCLSYCHHECCLRTNSSFQHVAKSYISDASNKEASRQSRFNQFSRQANAKGEKLSQILDHQEKVLPANRKYIPKFPVHP